MSDMIRSASTAFYTYHAQELWRSDPDRLPRLPYARPSRKLAKPKVMVVRSMIRRVRALVGKNRLNQKAPDLLSTR